MCGIISNRCGGNLGFTQAVRLARHLARANEYFDLGKPDKAEFEYLIVLKTDRTNPQPSARLGIFITNRGDMGGRQRS